MQNRAFPDATSKNAFDRFAKSLEKQYSDVFNGMSEEDSRQMESLKDLFEFLDEIVPEEAVNENGRKRATKAK
jgi:condensin complex subunit 3